MEQISFSFMVDTSQLQQAGQVVQQVTANMGRSLQSMVVEMDRYLKSWDSAIREAAARQQQLAQGAITAFQSMGKGIDQVGVSMTTFGRSMQQAQVDASRWAQNFSTAMTQVGNVITQQGVASLNNFGRAMSGLQLTPFQQQLKALENNLLGVSFSLQTVGSLMAGMGAALAAPLVASVAAAVSFEHAFADVRKTVEGTESQLNDLSVAIRNMSREIPVTANELAKIASIGGQMGVGIENIEKFTEVVAKMAATTNLSAESAAKALASISSIMQEPLQNIDRMSSTIVDLGNKFVATESDIVSFAERIAGAGKIAGMTTADVLGIATAFRSVGIQAEAGGTAVQRVLIEMTKAVDTGNSSLSVFAETAGITAEAFQELFKTGQAAQAFDLFVRGLAQSGEQAFTVLEKLFGSEARMNRAFISMAQASGTLTKALGDGASAWERNVAANEEFQKRSQTVVSQLQILANKFIDLGIQIGNSEIPLVKMGVSLAGMVVDFARAHSTITTLGVEIAAVFGAGGIATGSLLIFLGMLGRSIEGIKLLGTAISGIMASEAFVAMLPFFSVALPAALAVGTAAFGLFVANWMSNGDLLRGATMMLSEAWEGLTSFDWGRALENARGPLAELADAIMKLIPESWRQNINDFFDYIVTKAQETKTALTDMKPLDMAAWFDPTGLTMFLKLMADYGETLNHAGRETQKLSDVLRPLAGGLDEGAKSLKFVGAEATKTNVVLKEAAELTRAYARAAAESEMASIKLGQAIGAITEGEAIDAQIEAVQRRFQETLKAHDQLLASLDKSDKDYQGKVLKAQADLVTAAGQANAQIIGFVAQRVQLELGYLKQVSDAYAKHAQDVVAQQQFIVDQTRDIQNQRIQLTSTERDAFIAAENEKSRVAVEKIFEVLGETQEAHDLSLAMYDLQNLRLAEFDRKRESDLLGSYQRQLDSLGQYLQTNSERVELAYNQEFHALDQLRANELITEENFRAAVARLDEQMYAQREEARAADANRELFFEQLKIEVENRKTEAVVRALEAANTAHIRQTELHGQLLQQQSQVVFAATNDWMTRFAAFGAFVVGVLEETSAKFGTTWQQMGNLVREFAQASSSALSDLFFNVFTGQTDNLAAIFEQMLQRMLRALANFLADAITQQFLNFLSGALGGQGGGIGGTLGQAAGTALGTTGLIPAVQSGASAAFNLITGATSQAQNAPIMTSSGTFAEFGGDFTSVSSVPFATVPNIDLGGNFDFTGGVPTPTGLDFLNLDSIQIQPFSDVTASSDFVLGDFSLISSLQPIDTASLNNLLANINIDPVLFGATGGWVPSNAGSDIIPARLTPGEFVVNANNAEMMGPILEAFNAPGAANWRMVLARTVDEETGLITQAYQEQGDVVQAFYQGIVQMAHQASAERAMAELDYTNAVVQATQSALFSSSEAVTQFLHDIETQTIDTQRAMFASATSIMSDLGGGGGLSPALNDLAVQAEAGGAGGGSLGFGDIFRGAGIAANVTSKILSGQSLDASDVAQLAGQASGALGIASKFIPQLSGISGITGTGSGLTGVINTGLGLYNAISGSGSAEDMDAIERAISGAQAAAGLGAALGSIPAVGQAFPALNTTIPSIGSALGMQGAGSIPALGTAASALGVALGAYQMADIGPGEAGFDEAVFNTLASTTALLPQLVVGGTAGLASGGILGGATAATMAIGMTAEHFMSLDLQKAMERNVDRTGDAVGFLQNLTAIIRGSSTSGQLAANLRQTIPDSNNTYGGVLLGLAQMMSSGQLLQMGYPYAPTDDAFALANFLSMVGFQPEQLSMGITGAGGDTGIINNSLELLDSLGLAGAVAVPNELIGGLGGVFATAAPFLTQGFNPGMDEATIMSALNFIVPEANPGIVSGAIDPGMTFYGLGGLFDQAQMGDIPSSLIEPFVGSNELGAGQYFVEQNPMVSYEDLTTVFPWVEPFIESGAPPEVLYQTGAGGGTFNEWAVESGMAPPEQFFEYGTAAPLESFPQSGYDFQVNDTYYSAPEVQEIYNPTLPETTSTFFPAPVPTVYAPPIESGYQAILAPTSSMPIPAGTFLGYDAIAPWGGPGDNTPVYMPWTDIEWDLAPVQYSPAGTGNMGKVVNGHWISLGGSLAGSPGDYALMHTGGWAGGIPTLLEQGEFVVNRHDAQDYAPVLESINSGRGVNNSFGEIHIHVSGVTGEEVAAKIAQKLRNLSDDEAEPIGHAMARTQTNRNTRWFTRDHTGSRVTYGQGGGRG